MSITSDLKSYVDQTVATAQAQFNEVAENVSDIADKANDAVNDLRVTAEKAINIDALKTAVEPYIAQVREYSSVVTDRAEGLLNGVTFSTLRDDPRLAKFVETANSVSTVVLEQVNEYVVKPVQSFTGFGVKPAAKPRTAPKPAQASKPATTKPANKPSTRRPAAAKTTATAKTGATKTAPTARKSTARKTTKA